MTDAKRAVMFDLASSAVGEVTYGGSVDGCTTVADGAVDAVGSEAAAGCEAGGDDVDSWAAGGVGAISGCDDGSVDTKADCCPAIGAAVEATGCAVGCVEAIPAG